MHINSKLALIESKRFINKKITYLIEINNMSIYMREHVLKHRNVLTHLICQHPTNISNFLQTSENF